MSTTLLRVEKQIRRFDHPIKDSSLSPQTVYNKTDPGAKLIGRTFNGETKLIFPVGSGVRVQTSRDDFCSHERRI